MRGLWLKLGGVFTKVFGEHMLEPFTGHFLGTLLMAAVLFALMNLVLRLKRIAPDQIFRSLQGHKATIALIFTAALLPAGWRLALLPWRPVPEPKIHDEYGHLLVADTLTSGHLANPPHPLWRHLDTIYVLQHPTYASIYPIGQGAILAAGKFCR